MLRQRMNGPALATPLYSMSGFVHVQGGGRGWQARPIFDKSSLAVDADIDIDG